MQSITLKDDHNLILRPIEKEEISIIIKAVLTMENVFVEEIQCERNTDEKR